MKPGDHALQVVSIIISPTEGTPLHALREGAVSRVARGTPGQTGKKNKASFANNRHGNMHHQDCISKSVYICFEVLIAQIAWMDG